MPLRIVRLGTPRLPDEGVRLGTVRRPPRGVKKSDFALRNYYDVWLPELAPSAPIVSWALSQPWTDVRWRQNVRTYLREMSTPQARHLIDTLAALSHQTHFSVGCYCANPARCHRSLLSGLLKAAGGLVIEERADSPGR